MVNHPTMETPVVAAAAKKRPAPNAFDVMMAPTIHKNARTGKGKGKANPSESVTSVMMEMYTQPRNKLFGLLAGGASHPLDHLTTWVWEMVFDRKDKTKVKIENGLKLIDCCWTKEERRQIINHELDDFSAKNKFEEITLRMRQDLHALKDRKGKELTTLEPNTRLKGQLLGLSNNLTNLVTNKTIDDYLPDWKKDGLIKGGSTFHADAENERAKFLQMEAQREAANRYRRHR